MSTFVVATPPMSSHFSYFFLSLKLHNVVVVAKLINCRVPSYGQIHPARLSLYKYCTVQVITNNEMLAIQLPAVCDNISAIPIENILSLKTIT